MNEIILQIKNAIEKQKLSQTQAAKLAGVKQDTVNRMLSGKTKKPDLSVIKKLQNALGIVAEEGPVYGVSEVHRKITPEEENLLQLLEAYPDVREAVAAMAALPLRKQKIHLGKIFEDLEKLEEVKE